MAQGSIIWLFRLAHFLSLLFKILFEIDVCIGNLLDLTNILHDQAIRPWRKVT
jgi:hypothetical protein